MSTEVDLSNEPEGVLVQAGDGRFFFIHNIDVERFGVSKENSAVLEKMVSGMVPSNPIAHPNASCKLIWEYLMSHDPNNETWRRVSVMWIRQC
jgi:hypothetical protein